MADQLVTRCSDQPPHFVLAPLLAQGHTIPMVDLARLLAARGATVSFITTPVNAARIRPVVDQAHSAGLSIRFVELPFPCAEAGLPEGCENVDLIPSRELFKPFFTAINMLGEPLKLYLRDVQPSPSCLIADYGNYYTAEVARDLNIQRIVFHVPCCLFVLCMANVHEYKVYDGVDDEFERIEMPNLPHKLEVSRAQAPSWFAGPGWEDARDSAREADASADGVIVNTFYELEPEIIEYYRKAVGKPVWHVGPMCLCNKDIASKDTRGNKSNTDRDQILLWLDSKEPKSVLYVSFSSLVKTKPAQLIEMGCGLEASNRPFIWVIKEAEKTPEIDKWMSEGFGERTRDRGLVIVGWAPQMVILSHPSVAGVMTHCGWNSTIEAISFGFLNEKLVVEVLKIGVSLGVEVPYYYVKEDEVAVKKEELEKAIARLTDEGEEGSGRRKRAAELGKKAQKAMEEGGSSSESLKHLVEHFRLNSK